jgi:hypothetical protein
MKSLLAAAVLFFQAGSVMAGSCRPLEYAELKDSSTEKLVRTYCKYVQLTSQDEDALKLQYEYLLKVTELKGPVGKIENDIKKIDASLLECLDQRSKIGSALENRSQPPEPRCEAQKPGSSR